MPFAEGTVGPRQLNDGAPVEVRIGKTGEVGVADTHARYYEPAIRNNVFTIVSTAGALPAGTSPLTTATGIAPPVALVNPRGSGRAAVVLRGGLLITAVAGSPTAAAPGAFEWNYGVLSVITTAQNAQPLPNLLGSTFGGSAMQGYSNTALVGITASAVRLRPITGVITATSTGTTVTPVMIPQALEETAGEIVVPPGSYLTIMPSVQSTTYTVVGSITYEEVVYNYP